MLLDRETIKQLRLASEWVTLRAMWRDGEPVESQIIGKRRAADGEDYTSIIIEPASWFQYGSSLTRTNAEVRAYASISSPQYHELWQTFLACARTGDELLIVWSANGHANGIVREHGLCVDSVELELRRKDRRLRFHIDQSTTLPNSARMFSDGNFHGLTGPDSRWLATHGEAATEPTN